MATFGFRPRQRRAFDSWSAHAQCRPPGSHPDGAARRQDARKSPRQLRRAHAQFGRGTFREDLFARRMIAAAVLLSKPSIPMRDVARLVGHSQPSHFARPFRRHYGVLLSIFRPIITFEPKGLSKPA